MKLLILSLTAYFLFLAFAPGINQLLTEAFTVPTCCQEPCTPLSCDDNPADPCQDQDCHGKTCNPFQVCDSCALVLPLIPFGPIPIYTDLSNSVFKYHPVITSRFSAEFWNPPKTVII